MKFKLLKQRLSFKNRVFGFTLLEVLIVIALTATIAGVGISSYIGQQRAKALDNTVQEIVGFLRYAQQKSIAQEQGGQWGVHFENSLEQGSFYALNFDPDSGAFQNNHNLANKIKDTVRSLFRPFYAFARVINETERHYLPSGIKYQTPEENDYAYVLFQSLTGFLSLGYSYPSGQSYQQITLEDSAGRTANIIICKQGLIASNADIGICGELDFTPPEIGGIIASNTSFDSYVSSPFKLSAGVYEPEGKLSSCEYTINGGSDWYEATKSGTGPNYTCTKTGIVAENGVSLILNMRATSEGGIGTGNAIQKTVDAISPICSDDWIDNWTATSPKNITINCSDDGSGVSSVKYCIDETNTCSPSTNYTNSVSMSCGSGSTCSQYIRYQGKDNVGNASSVSSQKIRQDREGPTNGILTTEYDEYEILLSWSDISDSGSGLATADTYKLVFSTDNYPGENCSSGSQIYLGTNTSYLHTNLTNDITYYYRICAYDSVGNISVGAIALDIPHSRVLALGEICFQDEECASGYCYRDEDGDSYAAASGTKKCQSNAPQPGIDCDDNDSTRWVLKYKDIDGDGHCPDSTQYCVGNHLDYISSCITYNDCCDSDARVFPGQTIYYSSKNACGSWDYDCDGQISKSGCRARDASTVSYSSGWYKPTACSGTYSTGASCNVGSVYQASCGTTAYYQDCNVAFYTTDKDACLLNRGTVSRWRTSQSSSSCTCK
ncbi:MAG: hypothetical protein GX947_02060 [Tissierellia bacterium]|nr:hypothetical protein [Tissierellia bacterium]